MGYERPSSDRLSNWTWRRRSGNPIQEECCPLARYGERRGNCILNDYGCSRRSAVTKTLMQPLKPLVSCLVAKLLRLIHLSSAMQQLQFRPFFIKPVATNTETLSVLQQSSYVSAGSLHIRSCQSRPHRNSKWLPPTGDLLADPPGNGITSLSLISETSHLIAST